MGAIPRGFESHPLRQLVASDISLVTSFFISLQNSSCAHSAAPRFRKSHTRLACLAASALTTARCLYQLFARYRPAGGYFSFLAEISVLTVLCTSEQVLYRLLRRYFISQNSLPLPVLLQTQPLLAAGATGPEMFPPQNHCKV